MKTVRSLMILVAGLVPSLAFGSIVQTDSTDGPDQNLFPCSATDLIDASQGLASQVLAGGVVGGDSAALNDGSVGPTNAVTGPWSGVFGSSWTATYTLKTNVNTFGYTITNISTFAGWLSDRVDQSYGLSLAFVSDPQTFVSYGNFSVTFGSAGSSKIELTDPSGQIASGVCAIRFSINGGTFYREFDVSGMPTVQEVPIITSSNVTAVTSSTATFNGYLSNTGAAPTTVLVYWGATDKGTNATWDNVYKLADDTSPGAFSTNVTTGLSDVTCYYRYCATNSYGVSWATSSVSFVAGDVTIAATQPAASEVGLISGTFTVTRPAAATNEALVVYYTVAGSASNGLDYTTLTGSVTIPAASNSASITVDPIFDAIVEPGGENVIITLAVGAYHVGTPDQAIVTIADAPLTSIFAEGGMVTNIDGFIIHTFTNSDTLTVTRGGPVEILVVAGGGGGGSTIGGGGGAGGLIHNYSYMLTKGTHTIVVGAGGAGAAESGANSGLSGTNGADSSLDALIALSLIHI